MSRRPNDWYEIKFLESATNVRELVRRSSGRTPSAAVAREIAVCLQQGRLFFEAAEVAPLQIKPLHIYYGVLAFAQGVVASKRNASLSTLTRGHGLRDITPAGAGVEQLALRVERRGTFQEFNDAIAPLGRICYFEDSMPRWFEKPFDLSIGLDGREVTIKDVFSRSPGLFDQYRQTFGVSPNTLPITLDFETPTGTLCTLRIDDPELFADHVSLVASVQKWRASYPFLNNWRFREAFHAWGSAVLIFDNVEKGEGDDLGAENLIQANNKGLVSARVIMGGVNRYIPVADILPSLSGGYTRTNTYAMQPLAGVLLPEFSLQLLGSFLLSSLVRYRPQVWQNSISRSTTPPGTADDRSLSLIEKFLDDVLASFPELVVRVIDSANALGRLAG